MSTSENSAHTKLYIHNIIFDVELTHSYYIIYIYIYMSIIS